MGSRLKVAGMLFLATLLSAAAVRSGEQPPKAKLAVLDLKDKGVGEEVASLLTGVVSNKLSEIGIFEVINREDIKNMLTHEQDKILLGCTDTSCLAEIGGALGVEDLVAGEVGMVGKKYVIGLQRIDIRNAQVAKRVERQFEGSRERLLEEVANAAYKVVEDILKAQSEVVLLSVSEGGADISVDGKTVGSSPLGKLELAAGPRDLRVSKPGFIDWVRTIQVKPKEVQMLEVLLIPSASFIRSYEQKANRLRTWAWITLGTFLALEAGAIGLRSYTYVNYDPIEDDYNAGNYHGMTAREYFDRYREDMDRAEVMDYTALGMGVVGAVAGVFSLYFFMEGEDPDRYQRFRGVESPAVAPVAGVFFPVTGGGTFEIRWEF